jgi:hypothetical protein
MGKLLFAAIITSVTICQAVAQSGGINQPGKPSLSALPLSLRSHNSIALDSTGWRFASPPRAEPIDDYSGEIKFRIQISEAGKVESLIPISTTVSKAQEKLCREALLNTLFLTDNPTPNKATGYYTFKFNFR